MKDGILKKYPIWVITISVPIKKFGLLFKQIKHNFICLKMIDKINPNFEFDFFLPRRIVLKLQSFNKSSNTSFSLTTKIISWLSEASAFAKLMTL